MDTLTCGICYNPYDTKKHRPFTPSTCSHTACAACFRDLVLQGNQTAAVGQGNETEIPSGCVIICPHCQISGNTDDISVDKELFAKVKQKHLDDLPVIDELILSDLVPPDPPKNNDPSAPVENIMDHPVPQPTTPFQQPTNQGPQQPGLQQPQPPAVPFQQPQQQLEGGQYPFPQPHHHPQPYQATTPFQQPHHPPGPSTGGPGIGWSQPGSMPSHTLDELSHQGQPPPQHPPGTPSPMGWSVQGGHGSHVAPAAVATVAAVGAPVALAHGKKKKHKKDKKKKKERSRSSSRSSSGSRSSSPSPRRHSHRRHSSRSSKSSRSSSSGSSRSPPRHRHKHSHKHKHRKSKSHSGSGSS